MKTTDARTAARAAITKESGYLVDNIADEILWAYDKGIEDESNIPLSEWMADRDTEELINIKRFIGEELDNRAERQWDRMQENVE